MKINQLVKDCFSRITLTGNTQILQLNDRVVDLPDDSIKAIVTAKKAGRRSARQLTKRLWEFG